MAEEDKPEKVKRKPKVATSTYILKGNVGSNPDGTPKKKKGDSIELTKNDAIIYKSQNLI